MEEFYQCLGEDAQATGDAAARGSTSGLAVEFDTSSDTGTQNSWFCFGADGFIFQYDPGKRTFEEKGHCGVYNAV